MPQGERDIMQRERMILSRGERQCAKGENDFSQGERDIMQRERMVVTRGGELKVDAF